MYNGTIFDYFIPFLKEKIIFIFVEFFISSSFSCYIYIYILIILNLIKKKLKKLQQKKYNIINNSM